MNTLNTRLAFAAALAASLSVVACGGGGNDSSAAPATATPSAVDTSTLDSFLAYQKTQPPASTIDLATLQSQLAPVSDTTEPTPIN